MLLYLRSQQVVYPGKYLNIGPSRCTFDLFKFEFKIKFVRSRTHLSTIYSNIVIFPFSRSSKVRLCIYVCTYVYTCYIFILYLYTLPFSYFHIYKYREIRTNVHLQKYLNADKYVRIYLLIRKTVSVL